MSGYVPDAQAQMQPGGHIPYPTDSRDSLSPTPSDAGANAKHRRNYQACEGCRVRKVKCDLGPVDAPHKPPCKRCRRENKPCEFADTRKKRKPSVEGAEDSDNEPSNKRHRPSTNSRESNSPFSQPGGGYGDEFSPQNWPGQPGIPQMPAPGMIPSRSTSNQPPRSYPQVSPSTRQMPFPTVNRSFGSIKHDTNGESREVKSEAAEFVLRPSIETSQSSFTTLINAASAVNSADTRNLNNGQQQMHNGPPSAIRRVNPDGSAMTLQQLAEYNQALNVWNSAVFVRSDFFSAEEGIAYVEYFYDRLQPMTPVVVPDYRHYTRHKALLTKEPILALTILTIASRHMELTGFSQLSRRYTIHENLWRSLTSKVQRLLWGQEQFGGGRSAVNAGKVRELAGGQLTWDGSLRTLGSIEALLILTDWQPRALHFPPGNDDMQLLDRNFPDDAEPDHGQNFAAPKTQIENMPYSSWLEPAWRSDRMSWMLLGLAHSLSYELGVFEDNSGRLSQNDPDALRKTRIRRMVTVYLSQTSGRIGIPSPVAFGSDYTGEMLKDAPDAIDVVHGLWTHIAGIMHSANKLIFPSREFTMNLTRGLEYRERIEHFKPQLDRWQDHFDDVKGRIPPVMQSILAMEFEYARLYINSIGLQHVVESWVRPGANNQQSASTSMAKSVAENKKYIEEFTNAALHILRIVSVQMNHLGVLRDAPVRTFLRTLSAMMFTIKRLSLGTHERMARDSIGLLESVIGLFQKQVVDDVHLSGSTASMIEGILKKVKETMIRVQKPPHTSSVPSRDASRAVSPQLANQSNAANRAYFDAGQQYGNVNHAYSMDPLASIQGRPLADFSDKTFIWPNGWSINELDGQLQMDDAAIDQSVNSETNADWLAMPLDNFNDIANNDTIRVDQGMHSIGPTVGQHDMLEVLMEPTGFDQNLNGMGWGGNNYGNHF